VAELTSTGSTGSRFVRYWLPVLLYTGLIFGLSSIPGGLTGPWIPNLDKLEHLLEYGLYGLLLGRAFRFTVGGNRGFAWALGSVMAGAATGALDELYQAHIPRRTSDVWDWATDFTAVLLAVLYTQIVHVRPLGKKAVDPKERVR
jgi:hypothetical protein